MVDGDTCGRSRITCRSLVAHSSISLLYWNATATISGYFRGVGVYPSLLNFAFVTARSEAVTCRPVGRFAREQVFLLPGVYQWMRGGTCACMHDVDGRVSDRAGYFVPPGGGGAVCNSVRILGRQAWPPRWLAQRPTTAPAFAGGDVRAHLVSIPLFPTFPSCSSALARVGGGAHGGGVGALWRVVCAIMGAGVDSAAAMSDEQ